MKDREYDGLITVDIAYDAEDPTFQNLTNEELLEKVAEFSTVLEYTQMVKSIISSSIRSGFKFTQTTRVNFLTDDIFNGPCEIYVLRATHKELGLGLLFKFRLRIYDQTAKKWILGHGVEEVDVEEPEALEMSDGEHLAHKLRDVRISDGDEESEGAVVYE